MRQRSFLLFTLVTAILVAGILAAPARATDDNLSYARIVRLSYATGDVQLMRADVNAKWEPAFANMPIQQGFTIGTNNGRAEIEFEHGSALWLSENSVLQFTELALSDRGRITKMTLAQGTASFEAGLQPGDTFDVSTSQLQITSEGKSGFRIDAFSGGASVNVFSGRISLTSSAGTQVVAKGETLTFNSSAPDKATVTNSPARDNWDRWVSNRENYLVNGATQTLQNSNSPYTYGSADLSSYGSWNYVQGCGYGWQPYGMSAGWMPFLDGQWMNYSGLGWTWVSFEPWGWMPYHFGGWSNCGSSWMWMPGENGFWNPGGVQWVGVGRRIGWRPIPPRVNAPHPAASSVVVASKDLGKEGRYEVKSSAKISDSVRELPGAPLSNGKMPTAEMVASNHAGGGGGRGAAGTVLVPTAANLATLRTSMAGGGSPARTTVNGATPPSVPRVAGAPASAPTNAFANAAPPAARVPSPPPARSYAYAPSQPGQASARGSSSTSSGSGGSGRGWSGGSSSAASGSASRGSSGGSSSSAGSASSGGGSRGGGGSSAPASGGGGGGRPH